MSFYKIAAVVLVSVFFAYADTVPTIHQVYQAAESGDLNGAHRMVEQVLKVHPESAKAHYVDAEILVRQGNLTDAKNEFATAEKLAPGLPFAKPQAVQSLKHHLAVSSNVQMNTSPIGITPSYNHPIPWTMILLALGALVLVWLAIRSFSSRNNGYPAQYNSGTSGGNGIYSNPNNPYGPTSGFGNGQPYPPQSSGLGGGIMSGLATGAAAGAGFVAGEELMHHFMDGSSSNNTHENINNTPIVNNEPSYDMGGNDFGLEDNSSWDDNSSEAISDSGDDNW
ncbi:MAG: tetratricopeptide repeat protein [Sulfuricurvum sp.]|uniref:tetratricopeptide repeat protein n=1 Tax=Sulfuricurvum sp. TaxID=2025608 RepID=UPI002613D7E6|nr:tetratricopeptide repeat protein [Sulfuricurvum sp.]MDD2368654.1 tetratricopeptide repeat protein [Sulfuricurvum sp.]MDD5117957.1 tetratricopeptide repeat protein [Sulfuricurvum sp.]